MSHQSPRRELPASPLGMRFFEIIAKELEVEPLDIEINDSSEDEGFIKIEIESKDKFQPSKEAEMSAEEFLADLERLPVLASFTQRQIEISKEKSKIALPQAEINTQVNDEHQNIDTEQVMANSDISPSLSWHSEFENLSFDSKDSIFNFFNSSHSKASSVKATQDSEKDGKDQTLNEQPDDQTTSAKDFTSYSGGDQEQLHNSNTHGIWCAQRARL